MRFLIVILLAALAAGCSTVDSRIRANQAVFNALAPADQARVREGRIEIGDTLEVVRIALGDPDEKRTRQTSQGTSLVWIYKRIYTRYHGFATVGYERHVVIDREGRIRGVYSLPIREEIVTTGLEPRITIEFVGGRVASIEQLTR